MKKQLMIAAVGLFIADVGAASAASSRETAVRPAPAKSRALSDADMSKVVAGGHGGSFRPENAFRGFRKI